MTEREDALRPVDDTVRAQAKRMVRMARFGALATAAPGDGWPMASRVALATLIDGAPVFLASRLSAHFGALEAEPRCALLVGEPGKGDPLAHPRIALFCRAERLEREGEADAQARRRFLVRHPKAALYADFGDFAFWRLEIARADFNAGFGQAYAMAAQDLAPKRDWRGLAEAEPAAVAHMNADHAEAVCHYARLCGAGPGAWRLTGVDPDGADLANGDEVRRLEFATPVFDAGSLRAALVALARRAPAGQ
jgi:putative heme iron utilization protein